METPETRSCLNLSMNARNIITYLDRESDIVLKLERENKEEEIMNYYSGLGVRILKPRTRRCPC